MSQTNMNHDEINPGGNYQMPEAKHNDEGDYEILPRPLDIAVRDGSLESDSFQRGIGNDDMRATGTFDSNSNSISNSSVSSTWSHVSTTDALPLLSSQQKPNNHVATLSEEASFLQIHTLEQLSSCQQGVEALNMEHAGASCAAMRSKQAAKQSSNESQVPHAAHDASQRWESSPFDWSELMEYAKHSNRLVVVSIQDYNQWGGHAAEQTIFQDAVFRDVIGANFIFWQRQVKHLQAIQYVKRYRVSKVPHIGIIHPYHGSILWGLEGWTVDNPWKQEKVVGALLSICFDRYSKEQIAMSQDGMLFNEKTGGKECV